MTDAETVPAVSPPARPGLLIGSLAVWAGLFWALATWGSLFPAWPQAVALFLGSALLVGLSFALIMGFSRLGLHRTAFLALGAIGLALVILTAKPLAQRTERLDTLGSAAGHTLILTCAQGLPAGCGLPDIINVRNRLYFQLSDDLEGLDPEPAWRIFLLGWCQLLLAAGLGLWIGGGIDEAGHLIPVAVVATLADTWSVSAGATAIIIRSSTIHYFLLRFPLVGGDGGLPFLIGLSDFLFFGIFYEASVRFKLPVRRNVVLLALSFALAVAAALFFHVGLPVLPFMAVLFLAGNFRHLALKKDDLRMILLFLAAVTVVALVVMYAMSAKP